MLLKNSFRNNMCIKMRVNLAIQPNLSLKSHTGMIIGLKYQTYDPHTHLRVIMHNTYEI